MLFYFLREYAIAELKLLFPVNTSIEKVSDNMLQVYVTLGIWLCVTGFSIISDNPFTAVDICTAIIGTISILLLPSIAWIKQNGGYLNVFTFGYMNDSESGKNNDSSKDNKTFSKFIAGLTFICAILIMIFGTLSVVFGQMNQDVNGWRVNDLSVFFKKK